VKNLLITLVLALAVCAGAFGAFFAANRESADLHRAARERDAMEWLRTDFRLGPAQFSAIQSLHRDFLSECAEHCAAIAAARARREPPAAIAQLEAHCVQAMTEHFHQVAAVMAPNEGRRYLATVLPRIADYDHRGAPTLRVRP
jgi:hypothetical protein